MSTFFKDKVTTDTCNSWFKPVKQHLINNIPSSSSPPSTDKIEDLKENAERVAIAWPGTGHHRFGIMREPRWEDFVFQRRNGAESNRYEYFGNGDTVREERFVAAKKGGDGVRWEGGGWQDGGVTEGSGGGEDVTPYLKEVGKVDLGLLHEVWYE